MIQEGIIGNPSLQLIGQDFRRDNRLNFWQYQTVQRVVLQ